MSSRSNGIYCKKLSSSTIHRISFWTLLFPHKDGIGLKCENSNLDLSNSFCQGMDGASMSIETKGAAALTRQYASMTLYFHYMMYYFKLYASQAVNVASIRNCIDVFREITDFSASARIHIFRKLLERQCSIEITMRHSFYWEAFHCIHHSWATWPLKLTNPELRSDQCPSRSRGWIP